MQGNATPDNPKEYDFVPRYVSNLPVQRVSDIRLQAEVYLRLLPDEFEKTTTTIFAGYIMELTQPNTNQK